MKWIFVAFILSATVKEKPSKDINKVCEKGICYFVVIEKSKE